MLLPELSTKGNIQHDQSLKTYLLSPYYMPCTILDVTGAHSAFFCVILAKSHNLSDFCFSLHNTKITGFDLNGQVIPGEGYLALLCNPH